MPYDGTELPAVTQELIKIKQIIEERGWCQNALKLPTGEVCILGAAQIQRRGLSITKTYPIDDAVLIIRGHVYHIPLWNDYPGRTKEQVLALLDECIQDSMHG